LINVLIVNRSVNCD